MGRFAHIHELNIYEICNFTVEETLSRVEKVYVIAVEFLSKLERYFLRREHYFNIKRWSFPIHFLAMV
jgi:hypothetical protein